MRVTKPERVRNRKDIMTLEELKKLSVGDTVEVQWSASSPKETGTVVEVKKYSEKTWTAQVKTPQSLGEYTAAMIKLIRKAGVTGLQTLVEEFIEKAQALLKVE